VVGVYDRYVQLTWKQRRTLLRRWEKADREAAFSRLSAGAALTRAEAPDA
jgi:hypothetical protein